jgi:glycosyltransferase involved in cell wall biosynthesis
MVSSELHEEGLGGAGTYVYYLSNELVRQGHDVDVIASVKPGTKLRAFFKLYNVKLNRIPILEMLRWSIESYVCSMKLMQAKNYDVVNVHSPLSFIYPCLYSSRTCMVVTMHTGWAPASARYTFYEKAFSFLRDLLSCRKSRKVIVLNKSFERKLVRWGIPQAKVEYVPNAIDRQKFCKKRNNAKDLLERFGVPQGAVVLLYVGRLERGKGVEDLLEAIRMVQGRTTKPIWLLIVGNGSLRLSLMKRYGELRNVVFPGFLSRLPPKDDLVSAYHAANLLMTPSRVGEGMPTVLLEAMAAGLPVISTKVPGVTEVVTRDFGILVQPANPSELACAILNMTADSISLKKMGEAAASWSRQFDWRIVASRVATVFESCLESSRANRLGLAHSSRRCAHHSAV